MFYGKKIKQLDEKVAALEARVQTLEITVENQTKRVEAQSAEIYKLFMLLVHKEIEKTQQIKPRPNRKPKKNGKNTEAAK